MEYIPAKNHGPAANYPIKRVVVHATVSPCVPGGARAIANFFHQTTKDASTQFVVDPGESIRCVPDDVIAYGAPPNAGSIHVELTDIQGGSPSRWSDANHQAMLARAARLVASLCLKYDLPLVHLTPAQLRAGKKGICGHVDISNAWHQTDHIDPGVGFPWDAFLVAVQEAAHPTPAPTVESEVTAFVSLKDSPAVYVTNLIERRGILGPSYKAYMVDAGVANHIFEFDTLAGMNAFAGPLKAGTPDYNPTTGAWELPA